MLGVDARACVAQYVVNVYTTTPLRDRADAILRALAQVEGVGTLLSPIKDMEDVSAGVLPDLRAFLPLWVKRLQRFRPSKDEWETEHERWLREAVFRADGVGGLERIARKTKRPQACLAWCEALADQGDWTAALKASDAAARLVRQSHWRGELLDGAALAAQELGRPDLSRRLEAAWRAAPTMIGLLRWLAVDGDELRAYPIESREGLGAVSQTATRQSDCYVYSSATSPGPPRDVEVRWSRLVIRTIRHTLFPLLAMLLSNGQIGDTLMTELEGAGRDPLDSFAMTEEEHKPKLATPSMVALIQGARPGVALTDADRDAASTRCASQLRSALTGCSATPGASTTATPRCSSRRASPSRPRAAPPSC